MLTAPCPNCKHRLILNSIPEIGQRLVCENCQEHLEVTWLFPLALDYEVVNDERDDQEPSGAEGQFY
jgi:uncharacterized protein YbaR (Trm112 family)